MSQSNHLVILTPGFPADESDSTCLPMQQQLVLQLQRSSPLLHITVLSLQYPYFKKIYNWNGISVTSFNGQNKGGIRRLLLRRKLKNVLEQIHAQRPINAVLSFWYGECSWVAHSFAKKNGTKHVCWILGQDAKKENRYPRRLKLEPSSLAALSDFIQDEFEKNHSIRPDAVIMPGVTGAQQNSADALPDIDLLAAGSLIPLKQFDIFIEVVAELKSKIPPLRAMLIGDGPERDRLEQLVLEKGLNESIKFAGELPHHEVLKQMKRARVFVHPSTYEGFGMVCMEALAAGCQVISFVKPMKREIPKWIIAPNKQDMILKAYDLLSVPNKAGSPVVVSTIEDTVNSFRKLLSI